jgi:hypothetical protein
MPVDVAVEEPRSGVVRDEADRDIIVRTAHAHHIAARRVIEVRAGLSSALDNRERVSVKLRRIFRQHA